MVQGRVMDDKNFYQKLVEETLRHQSTTKHLHSQSLDKKLNHFGLNYLKGMFIPQTGLIRFQTKLGPIDIPSNWSHFKQLVDSESDQMLSLKEDDDHFLDILQHYYEDSFSYIWLTLEEGYCYLVMIKKHQKELWDHLRSEKHGLDAA
jgi:hypothetical protein